MTQSSYFYRGLIFLIAFSLPTYGLVQSSGGFNLDLNWLSYFASVGALFFGGVFCVGRANRYLMIAVVFAILVSYLVVVMLDAFLPISGYVRVTMYLIASYAAYKVMIYRNVLTMHLNRVKNSPKGGVVHTLLNRLFKRDLPTRETNLSLMMIRYAKIYIGIDLIFTLFSVIYFNYIGLGFYQLFSEMFASGNYLNVGLVRDTAMLIADICVGVTMVTMVIYDGRRPDSLGVGRTVTFDRSKAASLNAKS